MNRKIKINRINNINLLLENRFLLEKIGSDSLINDLTNKVKSLTQRVNNGENLENELQNSINKLLLLIKDNSLDESQLTEGLYDYAKIALLSGMMALGMNNAQAQEKINDVSNISSINKSADTTLSNEVKSEIKTTINSCFTNNKDVKQIVIGLIGKASQVTPPIGSTNQELALNRAKQARDFIKTEYGDKVIVSDIKTEIGSTKYIKGVSSQKDDNFTKEQGASIEIKAIFGKSLSGEFNSIDITPGKNPDNLIVYNKNGDIVSSTGFFGSGEKYHPHYVLTTTLAILKNKNIAKYNQQFKGSLEELKAIMIQSLGNKDDYYNSAMKTLIDMYNNNKPIYLYNLTDSINLGLADKGSVVIEVVTNDKNTQGSVTIRDMSNKIIKGGIIIVVFIILIKKKIKKTCFL